MDTNDTLLARIRKRFRPEPEAESWLGLPRKIYRFAVFSVAKARADDLSQQASALAFVTIVSLVPLLTALSFLGARWLPDNQQRTVELLSQILPYSEAILLETLQGFVDQAGAIHGLGFAVFVLTSLAVFTHVEGTINRIWNVSRKRPFRSRLLSFTLVLFWGPLVIGTTYSVLFYLRQRSGIDSMASSLPVHVVPFLVTVLGLTMLYWLVPNTSVHFPSACGGGLSAALLLEVLRQGFGIYVDQARNISLIYGGFGLLLLFMVSIQLAWWIVLLGSEVAYSLQNPAFHAHRRRSAAPMEGSWIALAALVVVTERFRTGQPVTPRELLADRLRLVAGDLERILEPLVSAGLLGESSGEPDGYLLACDPHELEVARVFELYEDLHWETLRTVEPGGDGALEDLRGRIAAGRTRQTEQLTLIELVGRGSEAGEDAETAGERAVAGAGAKSTA